MTPEEAREWLKVLRDLVLIGMGTFLLGYEAIGTGQPSEILVGAGITCYLGPTFLRADDWLKQRRNGNGNDKANN